LPLRFFLRGRPGGRPARSEGSAGPDEGRAAPPTWSIVTQYSIGPVRYIIYRGGDGLPRLSVEEPEPIGEDRILEIATGLSRPKDEAEEYLVRKHRSGYGKLYPLIIDPHIEEISYSGFSSNVAIIHKLYPSRWMLTSVSLTPEEADGLAIELARRANKAVSIASPYAEGLTAEGHRVSVSFMAEVSRFGSTFVIRKYPQKPFTIADLLASKTIDVVAAAYLWVIEEAQGFIVVSGSMGSGKTTVLQSLLSLLPPYVKVVTIEDTPELVVVGPLWDSLVTRPRVPGQEVQEVTLEDLLRFALRRRADYVVVGEVRGREGRLLAQAAASGYGALTTIHSDSPSGVLMRLSMEPIKLPRLFLESVKAIVQLGRTPGLGGKAVRRVREIAEVIEYEAVPVFKEGSSSSPSDIAERSHQLSWAADKLGIADVKAELKERAKFLESLAGRSVEELRAELTKFYMSRYGDVV